MFCSFVQIAKKNRKKTKKSISLMLKPLIIMKLKNKKLPKKTAFCFNKIHDIYSTINLYSSVLLSFSDESLMMYKPVGKLSLNCAWK